MYLTKSIQTLNDRSLIRIINSNIFTRLYRKSLNNIIKYNSNSSL